MDLSEYRGDYVILIPGLFSPSFFLKFIAKKLHQHGFEPYIFNYKATKYSIDVIVDKYLTEFIKNKCVNKEQKIHFIGHSMGCIIIRKYLSDNLMANIGKIIMIAPPNQGSHWCNLLTKWGIFKYILGPCIEQLKEGGDNYLAKISDLAPYELGIIAGIRSLNPLSRFVLEGENDGLVTVKSTQLPTIRDFIALDYDHLGIIFRQKTIYQIEYFLKDGSFDHSR